MAVPNGTMSDWEHSSSSSSDAEEPAWGLGQRPRGPEKPRTSAANNQLPTSHPSLWHKVDEHEQDGRELQSAPEFRAHVAKKLGPLLDSVITISEVVKEPRKAEVQKVTSEDDGFRLFFTSIPGGPGKEASPKPHGKRQPSSPSSEDSDEEWRWCRGAAVWASDILQESALHGPVGAEKEAGKKRKSKKKAKKVAGVNPAVATSTSTASGAPGRRQEKEPGELNGDHVSLGTKKKKRKKKARKAGEPSPLPPAKSAAGAGPSWLHGRVSKPCLSLQVQGLG